MVRLHGVGLRPVHLAELDARVRAGAPLGVDVLELMAEGFRAYDGWPGRVIDRLRREVPCVLHGTGLGLANAHALDEGHLAHVAQLIERFDPLVVSDHLCFTAWEGASSFDLLPFPLTERTLAYVAGRVHQVQERWRRPIAVENVSAYLSFAEDTLAEGQFLGELCARTGCGVLLDVNNLIVNHKNRGVPWAPYLRHIPRASVVQLHLAGHTAMDGYFLDTHIGPVPEEVWTLLAELLPELGSFVSIVEWDQDLPSFATLEAEVSRARRICGGAIVDHEARAPLVAAPSVDPPAELIAGNRLVFEHLASGTRIQQVLSGRSDPFADRLRASGALAPARQLFGYAEQFYGKLDAAMREAYPRLLAILGEDEFVNMLIGYWSLEPRFACELGDVPRELARVIDGAPALVGRPHLVELARLEWNLHEARDLGFCRGEGGGGRWNPSLRLLEASSDVAALWHDPSMTPPRRPTTIASWFVDHQPQVRVVSGPLTPSEAWSEAGAWWPTVGVGA